MDDELFSRDAAEACNKIASLIALISIMAGMVTFLIWLVL